MKKLTKSDLKEAIISKSYPEPNTGCWLWGHSVNYFGYGIQKASIIHKNMVTAHRVSYWCFNGEFDLSLCVLHKCDTPACVNPDHLFLGTQLDNIKDRTVKGRTSRFAPKGSRSGASKLTEDDILTIRSLSHNHTQRYLAKLYDVNQATIHYILSNKTWKHI